MIADAMPQHLPGVLHSLESTLNQFGYLAVVGLVLIEDFGVPGPGETVLILAAVYASAGRLNIVLVALRGFCGRRLAQRSGRYIFLTPNGWTKPPNSSTGTAARSSSSHGSSSAYAKPTASSPARPACSGRDFSPSTRPMPRSGSSRGPAL